MHLEEPKLCSQPVGTLFTASCVQGGVQPQHNAPGRVRCQPCRAAENAELSKEQQATARPRHQTPHSMATIARMSASATGRRHTLVRYQHLNIHSALLRAFSCCYFVIRCGRTPRNDSTPAEYHPQNWRIKARPDSFRLTQGSNRCWSETQACHAPIPCGHGGHAPGADCHL